MSAGEILSKNADWLNHLASNMTQVYHMVTGAAYIIGCAFAFKGLYALKVYGEARTMMATNASMKEPLTYLMVGAIFIYLPTAFGILMTTTFGSKSVLAYADLPSTLDFTATNGGYAILTLLRTIGVIAFVRGWVMISRSAGQGSQPGAGSKGLIHVVGGILLMNIVGTLRIIYNTLGLSV